MGTVCRTLLVLPWVQWWGQDGETGLGGLGQTFGQVFTPVSYLCEVFAGSAMVLALILQLRRPRLRHRKLLV